MTPLVDPEPPRLARWLLRLRPLGSRRREIEADLHDAFIERVARDGHHRAARRYMVDVLSIWRWNPSGARFAQDAMQDLTHGLRVFRRSPGPVATTVIGLALAIGVSTALVTLLDASVFVRVGVANPDLAVRVERVWKGGVSQGWPYAEFVALREMSQETTLEATNANSNSTHFSVTPPTLAHDASTPVPAAVVSGGYMPTFGARPMFGRLLSATDDAPGAAPVAVLGYTFWSQRLNADPSIVGRLVWLNGTPVTVVGIVERRFTGITDVPPAVWMPFSTERALNGDQPLSRTSRAWIAVMGRTPVSGTFSQAEAQVGALAAALDANSADPYRSTGVKLVPASHHPERQGTALIVGLLLSAVGLVVLLACVNVANLQLASAFARQREIGVRLALGASKTRIVRQLVTESIVLGWAAGVMGLALAIWLVPVLARAIGLSDTLDLSPDARVFAFLILVSSVAGIGAGLTPARYGARGDLLTPLKGDGPRVGESGRPHRLRAALIAVQAAASLVLLVIAALAVRAALRATQLDVGFDAAHLVTFSTTLGREDEAKAYLTVALDRLRAVPSVEAVALADTPPFSDAVIPMTFTRAGVMQRALLTHADAHYFSTLGLRTLHGRTFSEAEVLGVAPVVVVSESLAHGLWGSADPLGQVMDEFNVYDQAPRVTVIGVVSDAITGRLHELRTAGAYRPLRIMPTARLVVRTDGPPAAALPALRAALVPLDPRVRVDPTLVGEGLQRELERPRTLAAIATDVAALALALATIGIYGITAFVTGQRTREIGVRLAVGATRRDVVTLLLGDSLRPVAGGLIAGVIVALIASRLFQGTLYGVNARDPLAITVSALTLLIAAAVSTYIPTRRASLVNPVVVLRQS